MRLIWAAVRGAVLGFVLGTAAAVILLDEYDIAKAKAAQTNNGLVLMGPMLELAAAYFLVLPWVAWALLAVLQVRPAWLAAFGGLLLSVPFLLVAQQAGPSGTLRPAWTYGLAAAVAFGLAATFTERVRDGRASAKRVAR